MKRNKKSRCTEQKPPPPYAGDLQHYLKTARGKGSHNQQNLHDILLTWSNYRLRRIASQMTAPKSKPLSRSQRCCRDLT